MIKVILLVSFYLTFPAFLIWLSSKYVLVHKIGSVLLAYAIGLFMGNTGLLSSVDNLFHIQDTLNSITIPLAIPLLLFSLDIKSWLRLAGKALLSMLLGVFGLIIVVVVGLHLFGDKIDDAWKIGGMLVGVYTGGTPNLAALQAALGVSAGTYVMVNTIDILLSSVYLFFLMLIGKKFLGLFLPKFSPSANANLEASNIDTDDYTGIFRKSSMHDISMGLLLSILAVGSSIALSFVFVKSISMLIVILGITTMGIAFSLIKRVNRLKYTFQSGMYLILVFCMVVASMANLSETAAIAGNLFKYICFVLFGSLIIHIALSRIFKIDTDTLMVTSTALICSPPFVPVVAGTLKNKEVIVSGLTVGIIGYAVGNYLGITIAYIIR